VFGFTIPVHRYVPPKNTFETYLTMALAGDIGGGLVVTLQGGI